MEATLLFVYGTLRYLGEANELMADCKLINKNFQLFGYSLYDHGEYPFAIKSLKSNFILGDVYAVPSDLLTGLDEYEGDLYIRIVDPSTEFSLYVKKDNKPQQYPQLVSGNWFDRSDKTS